MNKRESHQSPGNAPQGAAGYWDRHLPAPTIFRVPSGARFQQMTPDGQVIHEITDDDVIKAVPDSAATAHPRRRAGDEPLRKRGGRN